MNARTTALSALIAMRRQNTWADGALKDYTARDRLDRRDAALAARLLYGVVQNRMLLDFYLAQAVASPLLDDLGVLQLQLLHRRQHHAVACLAGSGECGSHSVILPLSIGQLRQQLHQVAVITDGQTGTLR